MYLPRALLTSWKTYGRRLVLLSLSRGCDPTRPHHGSDALRADCRAQPLLRSGVVDVAAAGGWGSTRTLTEIYQLPDRGSMLRVVLAGGELRETEGL